MKKNKALYEIRATSSGRHYQDIEAVSAKEAKKIFRAWKRKKHPPKDVRLYKVAVLTKFYILVPVP